MVREGLQLLEPRKLTRLANQLLMPLDGSIAPRTLPLLARDLRLMTTLLLGLLGKAVPDHVPTTDSREIRLTRHTQPEPELALLLERLKLELQAQPLTKISAAQADAAAPM